MSGSTILWAPLQDFPSKTVPVKATVPTTALTPTPPLSLI